MQDISKLYGPRRPYPSCCVQDLFEEQARKTPDRLAVVCENRRTTYAELNLQTNRLARQLRDIGVRGEMIVGVYLENSLESVIALLATLTAGGAVLPLDREYSQERLAFILKDARPLTVLTDAVLEKELPGDYPRLLLSEWMNRSEFGSAAAFSRANPHSAASILYTSGSTGNPKGVVRDHAAILSRLAWGTAKEDAVYCLNMSLTVGLSQERLLTPLLCGRPLVVVSEARTKDMAGFLHTLDENGVTEVTLAAPKLQEFLHGVRQAGLRLGSLQTVVVGGDALRADMIDLFCSVLPRASLVNAYGSSEAGTIARGEMTGRPRGGSFVTVGGPVANVDAYVLGPNLMPLPIGEAGELYLDAPSLAREYLGKPELTQERFIPNPFTPHSRLFRTGDIARCLENGEIALCGRDGRLVKIRGHNVDLLEVETELSKHPEVQAAVVVASGAEGEKRLVAYVACRNGSFPSVSEFRRYLRQRLPRQMVPAIFVTLERLPRSLNGKIDVSALPPVGTERPHLDAPYEAPASGVERALARIWAETLEVEDVGVHDDFFELGGDSILAVQMLLRVGEIFQVNVGGSQLAENPTLRSFSKFLADSDAYGAPIESIPRVPRDESLRLSIGQEIYLGSQLMQDIRNIRHGSALLGFGLSIDGVLEIDTLQRALDTVVQRHEILRTGFLPIAAVGTLNFRGWDAIQGLFSRGPLKPSIRFEPQIRSDAEFPLTVTDLRHLSLASQGPVLDEIVAKTIGAAHDYASPPLIRAVLVRIADASYKLIVGVSHIIFDGLSWTVFRKELSILYRAFRRKQENALPELPIQFLDFAQWQRNRLRGDVMKNLAGYWAAHYRTYDFMGARHLPMAISGASSERRGGVEDMPLDQAFCRELRAFAAKNLNTPYHLFLASVAVLLFSYTSREKISMASYFGNRTHPDVRRLIGDFATAHRLGVDFSANPTISDLLEQICATVDGAIAHQEIPLSLLRFVLRSPEFSLQLSTEPAITCEFVTGADVDSPEGLSLQSFGLLGSLSAVPAPQPLRFKCGEFGPEITISIGYHTDLFEKVAVQNMLIQLKRILRAAITAPETRVSALSKWISVSEIQGGLE